MSRFLTARSLCKFPLGSLGQKKGDITIVTAFFDLGRGEWGQWGRSTDYYFGCFERLAALDNHLIVFTSSDLVDRVKSLRANHRDKTEVVSVNWAGCFQAEKELVRSIQSRKSYINFVNPDFLHCPEYWNADYVVVNLMKSRFVSRAISMFKTHEQVAWIDFGYCRDKDCLNGKIHWRYAFPRDRISLFALEEYHSNHSIDHVIRNNIVCIIGCSIVGGRDAWRKMERLISSSFRSLVDRNLVDDDQTLLLMATRSAPELFSIYPVSEWFGIFRNYNHA